MNRILAAAVRELNAWAAFGIVVTFAVGGIILGGSGGVTRDPVTIVIFGVLGAGLGFVVAIWLCGLIAVFVRIEHHLANIEGILEGSSMKEATPKIEKELSDIRTALRQIAAPRSPAAAAQSA